MEIDYNKVFKGFEFSLSWFVLFSEAITTVNTKGQLDSLNDEERNEKLFPLNILFDDLYTLVKEQGGLDFIQDTQQSDTAEQAQTDG